MTVDVKESYFWQQVKSGIESQDVHVNRIENTAGTGISDVNACKNGVEVWIELKIGKNNYLHFRTSQRIWILKRVAVGGRVFVLVRNGDRLLMWRAETLMYQPKTFSADGKSFKLQMAGLPDPLFHCCKPFRWDAVVGIIFGQDRENEG